MKITAGKIYAVITGDIIRSSKLPLKKRKELHNVMKQGSKALRKAFSNEVPLDVDIYSGDGWQLLVSDPSKSLRIGLYYRAYLRAKMQSSDMDTRMSIALGTVDFVPNDRVSTGDGEAYRNSGKALEKMAKTKRMCFISSGEDKAEFLDIIFQLIDSLASRWSDKQALAVTGALLNWKQEKIGGLWKPSITQQTVHKHLDRAGWYPIENAVNYFENSQYRL